MNIAIKGHPTRGREVIQLLEMLGGENKYSAQGNCTGVLYFICNNKGIKHLIKSDVRTCLMKVYTLEEFEEKFPYKVGDKVSSKYLKNRIIEKAEWESCCNSVLYKLQGNGWYRKEELQFYNEKNMEEPKELIIGFTKDDNGDWVLNTHKDYEIKEIEGKFKAIKKQPQYPKNYKECCKVLGFTLGDNIDNLEGYKSNLLEQLQILLICRDAYWKVYGEQIGLEKPWEPDWCNENKLKYCIECSFGTIDKTVSIVNGCFLAFPTKEMRDTFFENFKDLIEQCKELL